MWRDISRFYDTASRRAEREAEMMHAVVRELYSHAISLYDGKGRRGSIGRIIRFPMAGACTQDALRLSRRTINNECGTFDYVKRVR